MPDIVIEAERQNLYRTCGNWFRTHITALSGTYEFIVFDWNGGFAVSFEKCVEYTAYCRETFGAGGEIGGRWYVHDNGYCCFKREEDLTVFLMKFA